MPLITIKASDYAPVPPGAYKATFDELEETETSRGDAYRWRFTITEGTKTGDVITTLSDRHATTKNKMGRFTAALAGTTPTDNLSVNPDDYVGKTYLITVGDAGKIVAFVPFNGA